MTKYRKKPVEIDAWPYKDTDTCRTMLRKQGAHLFEEDGAWHVRTMEGAYKLEKGWYVIKGVRGEFYPCEAGIFRETYEKVKPAEPRSTIVRSHYDIEGRGWDTIRSQYDL